MYIREIKVETGHSKIRSLLQRVRVRSQVHDHRNRVLNLRRGRVHNQAQDRAHNRRSDQVRSQVPDLQPERATSFNATIKTEAREIQTIIIISTIGLRNRVTEVISRVLSQDLVVEEEEEGSKICFF